MNLTSDKRMKWNHFVAAFLTDQNENVISFQ
jgi:hypothetical protein